MPDMAGDTRFEVLGPVRARCDGTAVDVGPARQQAVLAVLAMRAGSPVSAAELLRAGWGDRPPAIGDKVVPAYVYRLRKALAAAGAGGSCWGGRPAGTCCGCRRPRSTPGSSPTRSRRRPGAAGTAIRSGPSGC
ncbi:AfsR/SARP family transcriptional regulator [Fodinicola feengrottensis]|uniref:AfsR/SARP family transcriptional regulator n=1 Tax=Fodinicola feengrottensis TaxID=435914 RepID=UPI0036F3E4CB